MTLTEFLLARVTEDEETAKAATPSPWVYYSGIGLARQGETGRYRGGRDLTQVTDYRTTNFVDQRHIARHQPAHVLAECEAKRRIVERVPAVIEHYAPSEYEWEWCPKARSRPLGDLEWGDGADCTCGADDDNAHGGNWFLRVLASVYADHPDYREEWAL